MNDQRFRVADIRQKAEKFHRIDKLFARLKSALDAECDDCARAVRQLRVEPDDVGVAARHLQHLAAAAPDQQRERPLHRLRGAAQPVDPVVLALERAGPVRQQALDDLTNRFAINLLQLQQAPQTSPEIGRELRAISTKWRFIEKSLQGAAQSNVPFLIDKYSDGIIADLEQVSGRYAAAQL